MAELRCPNCGKENPASLSVCQFCQAPLPTDSTLRIGEKPTKKNTGELERALPDWLQDVRKQARDSAEQDAAEAASMPKIQKAEPPDLLAGLASQAADADEDDVPDWLKSLGPKTTEKSSPPARQSSDFLASPGQGVFGSGSEPQPPQPSPSTPERDELSEWFSQANEQPARPFTLDSDSQPLDLGWDFKEETSSAAPQEGTSQPEEDLSWLRNLEAESRKTGELSTPEPGDDWSSGFETPAGTGTSSQDDLSWLNDLGALPETKPSKPEPAKPGEDLSWLNAFGETPQPPRPASTPPAAQQDDLSWLDDLGSLPPADQPVPEPGQSKEDLSWLNAFSEAPPLQNQPPAPSQDDLGWLKELDDVSQSLQPGEQKQEPPASGEDLSWLRDLQGRQGTFSSALNDPSLEQIPSGESTEPQDLPKVPPFTPRHTAPLGEETEPSMPDWLKSATEEPSLPLGPQAFDQIRDDKKVPDISAGLAAASIFGAADRKAEEPATPSQPEAGETSPLFSQDVDSIFSQDMPDWLTRTDEPAASQPEEEIGIHAEGGEALSPADLPSWVQAMRPVGAVIGDVAPRPEDLPLEREGPLAGLKGVLPLAAIGSLRRPRPIPLTLQASTEQQASAAIFEEILLGETTPRPVVSTPEMASQRTLRWVIAGLIIFILSAMIFSGTQIMPVSPVLPPAAGNIPNVVLSIAENAPVLVVVDYQPALAGEMEAVSGPLLDQLVQLRHPYLSFLATSPSGNVLVERLLRNTNISQPDGSGYVAGQNYTNMGYLPGGESGVLAFLQSPQTAIPSSPVLEFSEYAAILLLTDHAESARVWVEQLDTMKQSDPALASQPLLAVSSAQAGPMLQPYFDSGQVTGLINGLPIAARYESLNLNRPGIARSYWDAFGVGMMMAVILIVLGSLWSIYSGVRARSAEAAKE